MSNKQDELRDRWRQFEEGLAELSLDEAEAAWLGEARRSLEDGDAYGLGFCIQKLRDATPLLYEIAQLLCGHSYDCNVTFTRKRRGNPKHRDATTVEHYLLGQKIAATDPDSKLESRIEAEKSISRRTAFRALAKFRTIKPKR